MDAIPSFEEVLTGEKGASEQSTEDSLKTPKMYLSFI